MTARRWSRAHAACTECGTTDHAHHARGRCVVCYRAGQYRDRMANPERATAHRAAAVAATARWRARQKTATNGHKQPQTAE